MRILTLAALLSLAACAANAPVQTAQNNKEPEKVCSREAPTGTRFTTLVCHEVDNSFGSQLGVREVQQRATRTANPPGS